MSERREGVNKKTRANPGCQWPQKDLGTSGKNTIGRFPQEKENMKRDFTKEKKKPRKEVGGENRKRDKRDGDVQPHWVKDQS